MAYLTDKEKRLLFSALTREKKVCVEVDKECCREAYEDTLESVVKNLEKKFYYDRFEKEIRAKAIDDFAEMLKEKYEEHNFDLCLRQNDYYSYSNSCMLFESYIDEIAEQLKAGGKNEID